MLAASGIANHACGKNKVEIAGERERSLWIAEIPIIDLLSRHHCVNRGANSADHLSYKMFAMLTARQY